MGKAGKPTDQPLKQGVKSQRKTCRIGGCQHAHAGSGVDSSERRATGTAPSRVPCQKGEELKPCVLRMVAHHVPLPWGAPEDRPQDLIL